MIIKLLKRKLKVSKFSKRFVKTLKALSDNERRNLFIFIQLIIDEKINPAITKNGELAFIKKIGGNTRFIILKSKFGNFKEAFLGAHKYYDDYREKIGL